jgi:hypothetical protein
VDLEYRDPGWINMRVQVGDEEPVVKRIDAFSLHGRMTTAWGEARKALPEAATPDEIEEAQYTGLSRVLASAGFPGVSRRAASDIYLQLGQVVQELDPQSGKGPTSASAE